MIEGTFDHSERCGGKYAQEGAEVELIAKPQAKPDHPRENFCVMSLATSCALVPSTVCRDCGIGHASFALDMLLILRAWFLAISVGLNSRGINCCLVGRSV